jgi:hypothetical protein
VPVEQVPTLPAGSEIAVGKAPAGKALMFIHRGSYEALDSTYEAVTDYLDEKKQEGKDLRVNRPVVENKAPGRWHHARRSC